MRNWTLAILPLFLLAGCSSDDSPSAPAPVEPTPAPSAAPTPTPSANSPYAGRWTYRTTLTAVDRNCGHSDKDIGTSEPAFAVTVESNGTFALPNGGSGSIDGAGNVALALGATSESCGVGSGQGGCRDVDHCDGTSVQTGDVRKWTLFRQ